ncbi:putative T7SS-secreted protein [Streptomyces sp. NPDC051546]|uniref:putative T7SS-secreted protein n=1 Tax=Streptomyces sp. NPDC051546 TaxID=3365655 RepID=UPI003793E54E
MTDSPAAGSPSAASPPAGSPSGGPSPAGPSALGFDPAPGSPDAVRALAKKLRSCADSLAETSRVVDALVSHSSAWQGEAATAFRASLSQELPRHLHAAHTSLAEAARRLTGWHDTLTAHRSLAAGYASRAAAATTEEALTDVRRLARELASEHTAAARRVADTLTATAERLAPNEPGMLESVWNKIVEDPADALSNAAALLGAAGAGLALFFPPAGMAVMLVAGGLSLAALTAHLADPGFRKPLTEGFTRGRFDAAFWKNGVTLLGDGLGAVPGVAAVASGARAGTVAARAAMAVPEAGALAGVSPGAGAFARTTWNTADELRKVENPISSWALRSSTPEVRERVGVAVATTGAATAAADYTSDDQAVDRGSTAVDGTRLVVEDGPSTAAKTARLWTLVQP